MTNLYTYYTQVIFLSVIVINHMLEIYLSRRQLSALQQSRAEVPSEFKNFLSLEDHQKAINYSTSKLNYGQAHLVWNALLMFYWFPFRGAEKLYLSFPDWGMHREVLFLVCFSLIQMLLNLPWGVYSTFVMEEKHGFNRTTPKIFIMDRLKGLALGGLIIVPLLYAVFFLYEQLGMYWWLASFALVTIFQFIMIWLYPTYIAPLFNKFNPLEGEELKNGIEKLVLNAGFKARGVYVMDASRRSSHGNAYFTGFGKSKRVVFFDTLLKQLKVDEILAILAHELGHLKLKHIPKSLAASIVISFFGFWLMGALSHSSWFYGGHFVRVPTPAILILLFTQVISLYTFWMTPIGSWISRLREFEADAYAAQQTRAQNLITGLLKLYQQNASPVVTDKLYSAFYHSHPPALERIKRLESLVSKPG
ncbi:MAG TPA: M48 family metallopeptidase [Bacteriovoracaceae bacterium]|nr:M48 family metallopeptidase [Bacteriovoracaceae bacterium]